MRLLHLGTLSFLVLAGCQCGSKLVNVPDGLRISPAAVDFGAVLPSRTSLAEVTLTNEGRRTLELSLRIEGDERLTMSVTPVKLSLAAGESRVIGLEYVGAQVSGVDDAGLVVREGDSAAAVTLRGETIIELSEAPPVIDSGVVVIDAGLPPVDAGAPPVIDAGSAPVVDAGTPIVDAGSPVVDAGTPIVDAGVCVPKTCVELGQACGAASDGCGGSLACGTCGAGSTCSSAGQCVCQPSAATELSCGDGRDDDCDGRVDCADSDCSGAASCAPVMCSNQGDLRVSTGVIDANAPDLAFDGTNFGVAWLEYDPSTSTIDFAFARISTTQQLVGAPVRLTNDGKGAHPPRLAWNGEWAMAASSGFTAGNGIRMRRFDNSGATLGTPVDTGLGWPATIAAGAAGASFGVLWGNRITTGAAPTLTRVTQGTRAGQDVQVAGAPSGQGVDYGDLAWDGSAWAMVWTETTPLNPTSGSNVRFARFDAAGNALVVPIVIATTDASYPRLAVAGNRYGLTWQQPNAQHRLDVFFAVIDQQGTVVVPARNISQSTGMGMMPDVTWTGAQFALVWTEQVGAQPTRVSLARLDANGMAAAPIELASCGSASAWRPSVHFAAGKLAVAWGDTRHPGHYEVYARVLNP
jgi:hypothetical protein